MRRFSFALVMASTLLLGLAAVPSMAAVKQSVGERVDLRDGDQSFPASTAFHIYHGFLFQRTDNRIGLNTFELDMDGTVLTADFVRWASAGDGLTVSEVWVYNFPSGLTGTHEFTRHYIQPCDNDLVPCDGNRINTLMETLTVSAVVTFTP